MLRRAVLLHVYGLPRVQGPAQKTRSGIPKGEAPPLAPITLGGVEVDVSQEGVCSPRRVNMVYAPLATWYNTTGKGAALRAKHGPLLANPDAFNKWASMKEVTMAFLDDAGVPRLLAHPRHSQAAPAFPHHHHDHAF